ncbi:penicillin acylase family protein [Aureimonas altamirensis]|uniref:penicillin acylase family protein n=1 Tax=Aureimonas altamirensis TaxID=370622 RepID=UPI0020374386|nr:penicillin acylase family protein [Aureimonas altamirensis]MCM2502160.1 penicillin acylase family protein [Aureimonas altamirensis]
MSTMRSLAFGAALACLGGVVPAFAQMSGAVGREARSVAGLDAPAEILIDHWGIAHIYADSERDALFLQGYNAARDRLWQIDLWRKRGLGRLSESFGPRYVAQDRAARLFLYTGDMDAEWAAYGPKAKDQTDAFVAGVNAFVEEVLSGKREMPVEFRVSGTRPEPWNVEDVVRIRSHGLTRNATYEVLRARVACAADLEVDRLRSKLQPEWTTKIPEGLDPCEVPADVLADYRLATKSVDFAPPDERDAALIEREFLTLSQENRDVIGSNNWVIAPERSATGRPILANDPHRTHGVPSLRYIVHLDAPGLSVIGAGEPALPGISIGHNGTIAFGLTIFSIDQEDLYVYELNPDNPNQYRYGDGWEDMRVETQSVGVRNGEPEEVELRFTRHGPVLKVDAEADRAFALRTIWLEPGTSAYFGSSDYMGSKNWNEFRTAMDRFAAPSENQVYADTSGNIGWVAAGMTPKRDSWDGLLPVPGDGRYEWEFFTRADLPESYNPAKGWFATANQMNLPDDFPVAEKPIGFEWANPSRYERIVEVLSANDRMTLKDAMDLQNDDGSMVGRRVAALYADFELPPGASEAEQSALRLLKAWDGVVGVDSGAAAIGEIMVDGPLGIETIAVAAPEGARPIMEEGDIGAILDLLEEPDARLGADPAAARDGILASALSEATARARTLMGDDAATWRWGDIHQAMFVPDIAPMLNDAQKAQMSVGPLAMGGSASTPRAASYNPDFSLRAGASFRMVLDVGNWDASRTINTPGQSGDPASQHYRDMAPLWAAGAYVPLLYSRGAVETNTAHAITLQPAKQPR